MKFETAFPKIDTFINRLEKDSLGVRNILNTKPSENHTKELAHLSKEILSGKKNVLQKSNISHPGERYIKENLIWPLFDAHDQIESYRIEAFVGGTDLLSDFRITSEDPHIIGECKQFNNYKKGIEQVRNYTTHESTNRILVTDGLTWYYEDDSQQTTVDIRNIFAKRIESHIQKSEYSSEINTNLREYARESCPILYEEDMFVTLEKLDNIFR